MVSPLLANVVLNKLDWFLHAQGKHGNAQQRANYRREPNVRFVRYADDWCVFLNRTSKRYAEVLRKRIGNFLRGACGLELSTEKTHITHVRDGFDFLGFRLELSNGQCGKPVPKIKIGPVAKRNLRQRLEEAMRRRPMQESVALRLQRGSAVVRGWAEYYRIAHNFTSIAGTLDHWALWTAVKAISRKFDITTGNAMRRHYRNGVIQVNESCQLAQFTGIPMKLDYRGPQPYQPGDAEPYESDHEMEADFSRYCERSRLGNLDVKYRALKADGYRCRICGTTVTDLTSHADHIVPVKRFAHFALASSPENIQTLCLDCHREKHHAE